jgi:hypothetical protein
MMNMKRGPTTPQAWGTKKASVRAEAFVGGGRPAQLNQRVSIRSALNRQSSAA